MRKKPFHEHAKIIKLVEGLDQKFFKKFADECESNGFSVSKTHRRIELLVDIVKTNGYDDALKLYEKYLAPGVSKREQLAIKYGPKYIADYEKKLKNRKKGKTVSHFTIKYWTDKGLTVSEAKSAISKVQSENRSKRKPWSFPTSKDCKHSIDYWTNRGYTKEESILLREPYLSPMRNDLDSLILKYGPDKGAELYKQRIDKYKESCKNNMSNRKTAGYVSKESLKFLVPLYKACRKMGLHRSDIYFGVDGSREFFIRKSGNKNEGRFVDFCIPTLGVVIEYHGLFWHYRSENDWKNSFIDKENVIKRDKEVKELTHKRGFDYYVVWSDCDKHTRLNELVQIIQEKYDELHNR